MKAGNLKIRWEYRHIPIVTYCDIIDGNLVIATGKAVCHHKDHFCREKGRKVSLARAIFNAGMPKEERRTIWELYRNMKVGGRW